MNSKAPTISTYGLKNGGVSTTVATQPINVNNPTTSIVSPGKGIVLAKNVVFKTINPTETKPNFIKNSNRVDINNTNVQSSVQIHTDDNKRIIITGAKSVKDVPVNVLQQILSNVKNIKPNETVLVLNQNAKKDTQPNPTKTYESIVKDVLQSGLSPSIGGNVGNVSHSTTIKNEDRTQNAQNSARNSKNLKNDEKKKINETKTKNAENIVHNGGKKINSNTWKNTRNDEIKTSVTKNVIRNEEAKIVISNQMSLRSEIEKNDTLAAVDNDTKNLGKGNNESEKLDHSKNLFTAKSIPATSPKEISKTGPPPPKQKKFLYRLKSKNGKILSYVSDKPIILKKPVIRLDKMTQADAQRLSKQFAEEKRKTKSKLKLMNTSANSNNTIDNTTSQQTYGVQTRKRRLKFLPDGRIVKGKKSKTFGSSSSSLSSFDGDDDDAKPVVTSDDDYNEDVDVPAMSSDEDIKDVSSKSTIPKKLTPPKKVLPVKDVSFHTKDNIKDNSKLQCKNFNNSKNIISSVTSIPKPTPKTNNQAGKKLSVDPATVFSTLLKIPIAAYQLNVRRFKPNISSLSVNTNKRFVYRKIFSPDVNPSPSTNIVRNLNTSNTIIRKRLLPGGTFITSNEPPPLVSISRKEDFATKNVEKKIVKSPAITNHVPNQPVQDDSAKFEGFTNTKVVKTKEGPKKAKLKELKKTDEPRTIYDIMEEIFDSMPHWNIHVIPENKSFCLAQVSLGRTGIPVLKKSIEINSEFMAKVYVHQLHCRRYDGIYDTESKIRKLIQDVDSVAI